ncbi:MAG: hypothetical protein OXG24_04835 [Gammaproteobacteria bacterium]|nr:hypothetical protein [Gammaproteobacteria bacterium]
MSSIFQRFRNPVAFVLGLLVGAVAVGLVTYLNVEGLDSGEFVRQSKRVDTKHVGETSDGFRTNAIELSIPELQSLIEIQDPVGRAITIYGAIDKAGTRELQGLFVRVESVRPPSLRDEIQIVLVRRLAQLDPRITLDHISTLAEARRIPLVDVVFQEWSVSDLAGATEIAKGMENPYRAAAFGGILHSRIDLSDDELRDIAHLLDSEQVFLNQLAVNGDRADIEDPSAEWSEFLSTHGSDIARLSQDQRGLLLRIARAWVRSDGFGQMIQQISTSIDEYDAVVSVIEMVLDEVVSDDPSIALDLSANMSSEISAVVLQALANLAKRDPDRALEIASMMKASDYGVVFQRTVIRAWMGADPKAVLLERARLPEEFGDWIARRSLLSMVRVNPEEVPEFIPTITDEITMELVVNNLALNWARKDPMAVFEWLQSEPKAKPWYERVLSKVIENLARRDPEEAIRFALEQPPREYDGVGWESVVVSNVAHSDIEAAVKLTDNARDEKTREDMLLSIGLVLRDQGQFKKAMEWAENLKQEQRNGYYEITVMFWASQFPEQLYEEMDSLPSDEIRAVAAERLIVYEEFQKAFTAEQIEVLKKHLPSEGSDSP